MGSKWRVTTEYLQAGQPGPYQDTVHHVRAVFECFRSWLGDDNDSRSGWEPNDHLSEQQVRDSLRGLRCGFTDKEPADWASTRLDWIKKTAPGTWEFHTTSPYTG